VAASSTPRRAPSSPPPPPTTHNHRIPRVQEEKHDKDTWDGKPTGGGAGGGGGGDGGAGLGGDAEAEGDGGGAAAPAPRAPSPAAASTLDLLGLDAAPAPPPAAVDALSVPVTTRIGVDPAYMERLALQVAAASAKASGLLFEDASVQVGVKKAISGAEGIVTLFIGNKTGVPLVRLKVAVPEHAGVGAVVGALPASVAPKSQARVDITVESKAPFTDHPVLQLSFISAPGTGHAYLLSVPVAVANFCNSVPLPAADFKARWGALAGAPKEVTAMVAPASGAGAVALPAAAAALAALNFSAVDATPTAATGAATFRTKAVGPGGQPVSVGALAMVIPDAAGGQFKCAVRTQHEGVSKSVMAQLQAALSAL
jgi:hypothetical protein